MLHRQDTLAWNKKDLGMEVLNSFVWGSHLHKALLFPQLSREKNSSDLSYVRDLQEMKCYLDVLSLFAASELKVAEKQTAKFYFPRARDSPEVTLPSCCVDLEPFAFTKQGRGKQVEALTFPRDQLRVTLRIHDKKSCSWGPSSLSCSGHPGDTPQGWRSLQSGAAKRQPGWK